MEMANPDLKLAQKEDGRIVSETSAALDIENCTFGRRYC